MERETALLSRSFNLSIDVVPMMGAQTTGFNNGSAHEPLWCGTDPVARGVEGKKINELSLDKVHARPICAMLTLYFLASASTLEYSSARGGAMVVSFRGGERQGGVEDAHRPTISWLLGCFR